MALYTVHVLNSGLSGLEAMIFGKSLYALAPFLVNTLLEGLVLND